MTESLSSSPSKLPAVTAVFWMMKIAATTLGETAGDLLSMTLNVGYAISSIILITIFLASLVTQLSSKTYKPWLFWLVILTTSTAGTTMSDYMDRSLGLGYAKGSAILLSCLLVTLFVWYKSEKTIAIGSISSNRAEVFYWTAILFSNTLGTALGDYLADSSGLGFVGGAAVVAGSIIAIALGGYFKFLPHIFVFWAAFILTRPLGATVGDILTKGPEKGGIGFGTFGSSAVLLAILLGLIITQYRKKPAT